MSGVDETKSGLTDLVCGEGELESEKGESRRGTKV